MSPVFARVTVARTSPTTALLTIELINAPANTLSIDLELALSRAASVKGSRAVQPVMMALGALSAHALRVGLAFTQPLANGVVATIEVSLPADAMFGAEVVSLMMNEQPLLTRSFEIFLPSIVR